jgi:two-component system cell cycle response regulator
MGADGTIEDGPVTLELFAAEREAQRDEVARMRDLMADARDLAADLRDRQVASLDMERTDAAADRASAANDRRLAAEDRASALAYRNQVRVALDLAHSDGLTGAQRRDLGRVTLQREIERSRRSGEPFVLAFIDVDGLKQLNDRDGHAAGDALLQAVVSALSAGRRSYDPIVRVGGDEFLCGFTNTDLIASRRRIEEICCSLERSHAAASISVGLAMLGERDTLEKLIARADADMYSSKQGRLVVGDRRRPDTTARPGAPESAQA